MTTCDAVLPLGSKPREVVTDSGWLRYAVTRCTQSVGLVALHTLSGHEMHACLRAGHVDDVLAQIRVEELAERVREEQRPWDREELLAVRPEMRRYL